MVIGYHKYKNHIITIETDLDNDPYNNKFNECNETASYKTNLFTILLIEHITGYNVYVVDEYKINNKYNKNIKFVLDKNIAFQYDFIKKKNMNYSKMDILVYIKYIIIMEIYFKNIII